MPQRTDSGRTNQRSRTRKDLLAAAARLLKSARPFGMDDVAAEAQVSRATAYRYFPSIETLLLEAPLDRAAPDPADLFAADPSTDPADRIDTAEASLHDMCYRNEAQLRLMLAASLERAAKDAAEDAGSGGGKGSGGGADPSPDGSTVPLRQNRRTSLIEAALAPARHRFSDDAYDTLCAALALIFGVESMVVFRDVLDLDEPTARAVKSWAARALVQAALDDSARRR
jgi:AcrR family transcriptional regulator